MPSYGTLINNSATFGIFYSTPLPPRPGTNPISVAYRELDPKECSSPVVSVEGQGGGTKVERTFLVNWAEAIIFIVQALGYSYVQNSSTTPLLRRNLPLMDPTYYWLPAVRARLQGVNWKGISSRPSLNPIQSLSVYDQAKVTLDFEEVDYQIYSDAQVDTDPYGQGEFGRNVTFTCDSSVEYLSIPSGSQNVLQWSDGPDGPPPPVGHWAGATGPKTIPFPPGRPLPGFTLHYRWRQIPYNNAPYTAIAECLGRVNKTKFAGCNAGTLLMLAKDQELRKAVDGSWQLDLTYTMQYKKTGWNYLADWMSDPLGFFQVSVGGVPFVDGSQPTDGTTIFSEREFATLFQVQAWG